MPEWDVRITAEASHAFSEDDVDAILDRIGAYAGVVSYRAERLSVTLTVRARDAYKAVQRAFSVLGWTADQYIYSHVHAESAPLLETLEHDPVSAAS